MPLKMDFDHRYRVLDCIEFKINFKDEQECINFVTLSVAIKVSSIPLAREAFHVE